MIEKLQYARHFIEFTPFSLKTFVEIIAEFFPIKKVIFDYTHVGFTQIFINFACFFFLFSLFPLPRAHQQNILFLLLISPPRKLFWRMAENTQSSTMPVLSMHNTYSLPSAASYTLGLSGAPNAYSAYPSQLGASAIDRALLAGTAGVSNLIGGTSNLPGLSSANLHHFGKF